VQKIARGADWGSVMIIGANAKKLLSADDRMTAWMRCNILRNQGIFLYCILPMLSQTAKSCIFGAIRPFSYASTFGATVFLY
jgi:hypothetical protein